MQQEISIIVAFCKGFGIGYQNALPWHIPEDIQFFKTKTQNNIIVMGKNTYYSIPKQYRPLKNRINIVVTSDTSLISDEENLVFLNIDQVQVYIKQHPNKSVFFIGGQNIYTHFISTCDFIYATFINHEFVVDTYFDTKQLNKFELIDHSPLHHCEEGYDYRYLTYKKKNTTKSADHNYTSLLRDILLNGTVRSDRTGTGTMSVFGNQLRFDLSNSQVPLLTTKQMPWKSVIKELLWFLRGSTNVDELKAQGVNIWNANSTREFLDSVGLHHLRQGDIGPMYGFQWRHYGAEYKGCDHDYTGQGIDQLSNVIKSLKEDPYSRRILMTTVNMSDIDNGCLYPCHGNIIQFYVSSNKTLSCHMYQRSVDSFLGLTWNIFSYAVLTFIIAMKTNLMPSELVISTGDTHLYMNHIEQAKIQIQRNPFPAPKLILDHSINYKTFEEITVDDFELVGYFHHSAIKADMSL